jgi:hypothetical protein
MASMNLQGQPGELRMTIEIKRKETGKVETVELVGHADPEKLKQILENEHGSNAQHSST